jgi:hypothetical protein
MDWQYGPGFVAIVLLVGLSGCAGAAAGTSSSTAATTASVAVVVSPNFATLPPGGSQQFAATVTGVSNPGVTWYVNGQSAGNSTVGTITSSGLYLAPGTLPSPPIVSVTASAEAAPNVLASAIVTVARPTNNQDVQAFPIKLGTTGGNVNDLNATGGKVFCCSGTLGALVQRGGQQFILSNNHVLDRSDQGSVGDAISQPGLADANCDPQSVATVAHLSQAAPLKTSNVDAALAAVVTGAVDPSGTILDLGTVAGSSIADAPPASTPADPAAVLGAAEPVAKSGRATGLTCSTLESVKTSVQVDYQTSCQGNTAFTVTFTNQVVVQGGAFSSAGDSGALILTADTAQPVALLYAGNSDSSTGNPIADVLAALKDPATSEQPVIVGGGPHPVACLGSAATANHSTALNRSLSQFEIERATAARDAGRNQLLADPSVATIDIGASDDAPGEAALVIQTRVGVAHNPMPAEIGGVRTKVIPLQASGTAPELSSPRVTQALSLTEISHSAVVKDKYADALLHEPSVIGVGVGASLDAPGESAVVVYMERGMPPAAIPALLDGRRTRLITTDRFRSLGWGHAQRPVCAAKK